LAHIDREIEKTNTSRAQWLSSAVVQYLAQQKIAYEKLWKDNQQLGRAEKAALADVDQAKRELGPLKDQYA